MEASTKNVSNAIQNENQKIIDDYIEARKTESNLSINFRNLVARTINSLARHVNKNLKNVTRANVISFLNSLRKSETVIPRISG
ncbi:MAG: hypothetical protein QOK80_10815 [Nitrososphaeraceae archaeon]|nr:hypothetical protein [Nitrososphaeraceae archaeon]MDW0185746.1 hypothetical protein [Nitrososphaeraceae archaeon]